MKIEFRTATKPHYIGEKTYVVARIEGVDFWTEVDSPEQARKLIETLTKEIA